MARELRFFRNVMDPDRAKEGAFYSVEIRTTTNPQIFQWRMMIVQNAKEHNVQIGEIKATVQGFQGEKARSLPIMFEVDDKPDANGKVRVPLFRESAKRGRVGYHRAAKEFQADDHQYRDHLEAPEAKNRHQHL